MYNLMENNQLTLVGKVSTEPRFYHEAYDEKFYTFDVDTARLSDNKDTVPVLISEKLLDKVSIGEFVKVTGQIRTYNKIEEGKRRLLIFGFAKDFTVLSEEEANKEKVFNEIILKGFICKPTMYRETPLKREICDVLVAVNRAYKKSDYIPVIAWERNAKYCSKQEVGTELEIVGRLQSRPYNKKDGDNSIAKVAYEVSINKVNVIEK
jgi:hypothetical protein